ncbi:Alpha/Beta hydrolase fold [Sesbania bispinosa]|nr:Alpha/Beta hydrolase fold [Sesbania bispinosa]
MDDILTNCFILTSYISDKFKQLIEALALRDVLKYTQIFGVTPVVIHTSKGHTGSTSLQPPQIGGENNGTWERRAFNNHNELSVDTRPIVLNNSYIPAAVPSFLLNCLTLPLFGLQYAWSLGMASWRCSFSCIRCTQVHIHRNGKHSLPNSYVYLLIPGLFSNLGPLYFVATKRFFSKMGLACHIAKVHNEASVEHNALELKLYIEEIYWGSGKPVMLLGHSKGAIDAAAALSIYWSDLKDKVAGLALVQCPYGGTPIASDILREGQIADKETRRILELIICKIIKGDMRALEDLTYEKRKEFIMKHKLPLDIPLISFHSEASIAPSVLATMTQIAHAELPWLVLPKFGNEASDTLAESGRKVPVIVPASAAMAVCALHLLLRYGEKSDGLVTCRDAEVPGSVVVRPNMKFNHAWMVYSSKKKNPNEPDAREMCEALLTLLVELGETKRGMMEQVLQ